MSQKGLSNILVIIMVAVITTFLIGGGAYVWRNTASELENKIAQIAELETENTELIASGGKFSFSQEIVEKAREVGVQARKSVVKLEIRYGDDSNRMGVGTAWFLAPGLLITNGHVVDGGVTFTGHTVDGDTFSAELISFSLSPDIAVLRTTYTKAPPLPVGSSEGLKEGDPLVQVGHPGGYGNWLITLGEFVKTDRDGRLFSNVPGDQGSSGSPILTLDGKVVGMTTGGTLQRAELFAPPSNSEVYQFLEGLSTWLTRHVPIELVLEKVAE